MNVKGKDSNGRRNTMANFLKLSLKEIDPDVHGGIIKLT
jgi:hypothetical protein